MRRMMKPKAETPEMLAILDRCVQIVKEDRLVLRTMIKENNSELITLLTTYKRKNDLKLLQQELRRFLTKGKRPQTAQKENIVVPRLPAVSPSPAPRSVSKQRQKSIIKLEQSPRFNNEENKHQFLSPQQIEQQKAQLHQFEQKLKLYTSAEQKPLFERNEVVMASFQNINPQAVLDEYSTVKCEYETMESQRKDRDDTESRDLPHRRLFSEQQSKESVTISHQQTKSIQHDDQDDIMKKYADLFTSPQLLEQCKITLRTFRKDSQVMKSDEGFPYGRNIHSDIKQPLEDTIKVTEVEKQDEVFMPCQSMVCKQNVFHTQTSESIFNDIFSEPTLFKISRAFFRFKMENVYHKAGIQVTQQELNELFDEIRQQESFIDVNEMGNYLDQICRTEDRSLYYRIDVQHKGYFTKQDMQKVLQDQNLVNNYFQECDLMLTNRMTYWEFYLKRNTQSGKDLAKAL